MLFTYRLLFFTPIQHCHLDFVLLTLLSDAEQPAVRTEAFEFKYLLKEDVAYSIGNEVYVLEEGDSLFFDARELHNPKNIGKDQAKMLVVYPSQSHSHPNSSFSNGKLC